MTPTPGARCSISPPPRCLARARRSPTLHVVLAQAVAGDGVALDGTGAADRGPRGRRALSVRAVSFPLLARAFAAFEQRDFAAAIDALEPVVRESERLGGSRAQLDLVEFTLLKAYLNADRRRTLRAIFSVERRPGPSGIPVAGMEQAR